MSSSRPPRADSPETASGHPAHERRARARARRGMDQRVLSVVDRMSDAFLSFDPAWRVEYANHEAGRLNGCAPEELIGVDHWTRWPETRGSEVERHYRRAVAERVPVQFEHHYEGSGIWHDIRAYPSEDGGLAVFYRDITRQKAAEAERLRHARELRDAHDKAFAAETQFRLLVDRVQDYAIFLLDPDGIITHWGLGAERMKGYTAEEIVGRHLSTLYPPGEASGDGSAEEHLRHTAATGEYTGEGWRRRRDGSRFPARVVLTALRRGGEVVGFSKITYDLTAERRREAVVRDAMLAAESASRAKSQFLANTSHEIRTPLNAVIGYAELMALGIAGPLSAQQEGYVERIRSASGHLLSLINDVLDLSRIEAGAMRAVAEPVAVRGAVAAALELVAPQATLRRIQLVDACAAAPEAAVLGDVERTRQILVNLLSNAVRFTAPGGRVTVGCLVQATPPPGIVRRDADAAPEGWTAIEVTDTGCGIEPDELERVWDAFVQVDASHTRSVGGSGLGLTISRHLARLMGGDVVARSTVGEGSTFTLWLPAAPLAEDERTGSAASPPVGGSALLPDGREAAQVLLAEGEAMLAECERLVETFVARMRADERIPSARRHPDTAVMNHVSTFIADVGYCLTGVAASGGEAMPTLRDGTAIQRLIAERHGEQRQRLGFAEDEVAAELEILRATLLDWLDRGPPEASAGRAPARALVRHMVEMARGAVLGSFRAAGG